MKKNASDARLIRVLYLSVALENLLTFLPAIAEPAKGVATLMTVQGRVVILRDGEPIKVAKGIELNAQDQVVVGTGKAAIVLRDKSVIFVNSRSSLKITESMMGGDPGVASSKQIFELVRGKMAAFVKPQKVGDEFKVKTRAAVMGIRGTRFVVMGANQTKLVVLEGKVAVRGAESAAPEALVKAGEAAILNDPSAAAVAEPADAKLLESAQKEDHFIDSNKSLIATAEKKLRPRAPEPVVESKPAVAQVTPQPAQPKPEPTPQPNPPQESETLAPDVFVATHEIDGGFTLLTPTSSLRHKVQTALGVQIGATFLGSRSDHPIFSDWGAHFSFHKPKSVDPEVSGQFSFFDVAVFNRRGLSLTETFEVDALLSARLRRWSGSTSSKVVAESKKDSGYDFGPALGLQAAKIFTSHFSLFVQASAGYWLQGTKGVDAEFGLGANWRFYKTVPTPKLNAPTPQPVPVAALDPVPQPSPSPVATPEPAPVATPQPESAVSGPVLVNLNATLVNFKKSSSELTPSSASVVERIGKFLADNATEWEQLEVGGHTDKTGNDKINNALSTARAESVLKAIVAQGVASSKVTARGYGSTHLLPNEDQKSPKHRRVELIFFGVKDAKKIEEGIKGALD